MTSPAPLPPSPQDWLRAYVRVQTLTDRQILAMLSGSLKDINRDIAIIEAAGKGTISEAVRIEQMRRIKASMLREQAQVFTRMGQTLPARRAEAAAAAILLGVEADSSLFALAGRQAQAAALRAGLIEGLSRTVEVAVTRMTQSAFPLSERIYRTNVWMNGRVDKMVNSALARGLTVDEFAREARNWFNPNTPGGMRYASLRLARSEVNNAYHAISVNAAAEKPWVTGMKWHLSGSHPKPDACDELAHEDKYQMGPGVFPAKDVPRKPHPQCLCVVTPELEDEDAFLDNLVAGRYDDYLARKRAGLGAEGRGGRVAPPTPGGAGGATSRGPTARLPGVPGTPDPAVARQVRQAQITRQTGFANLAADVDAAGGDRAAAMSAVTKARKGRFISRDEELEYATELGFGGPERLRRVLDRQAGQRGLQRIGNAGAGSRFDPDVHQGPNLRRGAPVTVQRRGYSLKLDSGEEVQLFKAQVLPRVTGPTPAQAAALRRVSVVNSTKAMPDGLKTQVSAALRRQARLTPNTFVRLNAVQGTTTRVYTKFWGQSSSGAHYSPVDRRINLNPAWARTQHDDPFDNFDNMNRTYSNTQASGWHVQTGRSGIDGVVSHEYGHHVHWTMNHGSATWATQVQENGVWIGWGLTSRAADRLLPVLSRELGVSLPRNWSPGQPLRPVDFDSWVKNRKLQLQAQVSQYGGESAAELLAEIWAEYSIKGSKARPRIRAIGEVMRELAEGV